MEMHSNKRYGIGILADKIIIRIITNKIKFMRRKNLLNPSKEARTISPGRRLKNFLPTLEFTIELVKNPDTLTTPERIPVATFSDILVNFLTLKCTQYPLNAATNEQANRPQRNIEDSKKSRYTAGSYPPLLKLIHSKN